MQNFHYSLAFISMSEFKERLTAFLKAEGVTKSEFSRIMGLSPAYVGSMRKSMPSEKIKRLLQHFPQLNRDWLIYGEGDMYIDEEGLDRRHQKKDEFMVPLIPMGAAAGSFPMISEGVNFDDCEFVRSPVSGVKCAIQVVGDSMEPEIHDGTYLFLQLINDKAFIPWGEPLVLDTENGPLVKKLMPCRNNSSCVEAWSYNPDYPPFEVPKESIYGIYRIKAYVSRGRNT